MGTLREFIHWLKRPHLGPIAIMSRSLVAGRREEAEDGLAFLKSAEHMIWI